MRIARIFSFACVGCVVVASSACSSSSDSTSTPNDTGTIYDGPYDDVFTGRPDDGPVDSGSPEISGETSTDAGGETTSDASDGEASASDAGEAGADAGDGG